MMYHATKEKNFSASQSKNSFGVIPAHSLQLPNVLSFNESCDVSLLLSTLGPVQKMEPLNNLQVAIKNNVGIFYFACLIPIHVFFTEEGRMDRRLFLSTWKELPPQNEAQYLLENINYDSGTLAQKLEQNNIFTIARQEVEGQIVFYQSIKLTNKLWILTEVRVLPVERGCTCTLSLKSVTADVASCVYQAYQNILES